jgi:thymidylate synthase (FAD)
MQEVEYISHSGSDTQVAMAARVSFANDKDTRSIEDNTKLIKYLAKHAHWSPFAHTSVTLRMKAPIPIRTQCMKHAVGFIINEESRRYISGTPEYFIPTFRTQADNKKQGSGGTISPEVNTFILNEIYNPAMKYALETYESLLEEGVAEEQARFVLPQGCMVNWYWTGSLAAFSRFYSQRTDSHAQLEIQQLAKMVGDIIQPLYPISWAALTGDKL